MRLPITCEIDRTRHPDDEVRSRARFLTGAQGLGTAQALELLR
jgi:hypothetical protein